MVPCGILAAGVALASQGAQNTYSRGLGTFERLNGNRPVLSRWAKGSKPPACSIPRWSRTAAGS